MILLASLAWEKASQSQSQSQSRHRRYWRRHRPRPRRPPPPPPGPPSRSSTEDYSQKASSHRRRCPPQRNSGLASHPRWMMGCLET